MQIQILINIGHVIPIFICVFFTIFLFGSVLRLLFDDFFHIAFGYTISL